MLETTTVKGLAMQYDTYPLRDSVTLSARNRSK
jgi:hypothetical protein